MFPVLLRTGNPPCIYPCCSTPGKFTAEDPVAVYMPMSYQIGGYTLFLPRSCLTPLDIPFEQAMKLVLTGSVTKDREPGNQAGEEPDAP